MARPIWRTKPGTLGTIAESRSYSLQLVAEDPDQEPLRFSLVSGNLPRGLSLSASGLISGTPLIRKDYDSGRIADISVDVSSTFVIRASSMTGNVADRTFSITVAGQDAPTITTPEELLGEVLDGEYFEFQLSAVDDDGDNITWFLHSGELPPGISLNTETGLISGYLDVAIDFDYGEAGWSNTEWDTRPWDFLIQTLDRNYQFTVGITDGTDYDIKTFRIYAISNDSIDEDEDGNVNEFAVKRTPALFTPAQNFGPITHDNYFSYKFDGYDFDGDVIEYILSVPVGWPSLPGLSLNIDTGWLHGYIPEVTLGDETFYKFTVQVRKKDNPERISDPKEFNFSVVGGIGSIVTWLSDTDLVTIRNGEASEFTIESTNLLDKTLFYRLSGDFKSGIEIHTPFRFIGDGSTIEFLVGLDITDRQYQVLVDNVEVDSSEYSVTEHAGLITFDVAPDADLEVLILVKLGFVDSPGDKTRTFLGDGVTTRFALMLNSENRVSDVSITNAPSFPDYSLDRDLYIVFDSAPSAGAIITLEIEFAGNDMYSGKLPQGLRLESDGNITGRATFNGFSLDGKTTTFDLDQVWTPLLPGLTTFDRNFSFYVTAYDQDGLIEATKKFSITLEPYNDLPYDNLYGIALMPEEQRIVFRNYLNDLSKFPTSYIYRDSDIFFGKANDIRILLAAGISPVDAVELQSALEENHYNKDVRLGEIKTARALGDDGNVKYEVVYLDVVDDQINKQGVSVSKEIVLNNNQLRGNVIYPNSLRNMRDVIYDAISQVDNRAFPDWMQSVQEDGTILGFVPAVVLCYTKPGKSKELAFNLKQSGVDFTQFDIRLDRYIWDCNLSKFYDYENRKFETSEETTFDQDIDSGALPFFTQIDLVTELPFSAINYANIETITGLGGIDGVTSKLVGSTLIFAKQQNYQGLDNFETGWELYKSPFDSAPDPNPGSEYIAGGFDSDPFDEMEIIPGYTDRTIGEGETSVIIPGLGENSQALGVWRIIEIPSGELGPTGVLGLEFVELVPPNNRVRVSRRGFKYGGLELYYDPESTPEDQQPEYTVTAGLEETNKTTFDLNGTRFLSFKEEYANTDVDDKYIKFPYIGVLNRL